MEKSRGCQQSAYRSHSSLHPFVFVKINGMQIGNLTRNGEIPNYFWIYCLKIV